MAVKIRLARFGRTKRPFYRIVAAENSAKRDGRYIDRVGTYDPVHNPPIVEIDEEKAIYWLDNGAIPTDTVSNLLKAEGILYKRALTKRGLSPEAISEEMEKWSEARKAKKAAKLAKNETPKVKDEPKEEVVAEAETSEESAEATSEN